MVTKTDITLIVILHNYALYITMVTTPTVTSHSPTRLYEAIFSYLVHELFEFNIFGSDLSLHGFF